MLGKEKTEHNAEHSIGNVTGNTFYGNVGGITAGTGNTTTVLENRQGENLTRQISDAEWVELAKFFIEKQLSSNVVDQEYQEQYSRAEELVKRKDRKALRDFLKNVGGSFLKIVMGAGVQAGIREIISKVME